MVDPFSILTAGAGFAVTAGRFIAQLASVRDDTGIIIEQLKVITMDVVEAVNLRHQHSSYLSEAQKHRVDRVIEETKQAVTRIAKQVEPARRDVAKRGTVNIADRVDWVFRRSAAVTTYQHSLSACQQSLQGQIGMLRMAALTIPAQMPPPYRTGSWSDGNVHLAMENLLEEEGTQNTPVDEEADSVSDGDGISYHDIGMTLTVDALLVDEKPPTSPTQPGDPSDTAEHTNELFKAGAPTPIELHSERMLYEEMQRLPNSKRRIVGGRLHPERELYEQMQQYSR